MNAAELKKTKPWLVWLLVAGGAVFVCCAGSLVFGLAAMGSESLETTTQAATTSPDSADRWQIAYEVGRATNFTQSLPGDRWVALFGIEMDIHDHDAIRSGSGKRNSQGELYDFTFEAGGDYRFVHVTRSVLGFTATGVEMTETGSYTLNGTTLTLSPSHQEVVDFVEQGNVPRAGEDLQPREYQIVDLALEPRDHRMEPTGAKFLGLMLSGPTPFGDDRSPFVLQLQRVR